MLIGRETDINIDKYVGRIENNKKSKKKEVFYCEVCKEGFTVDLAYITHLNSPQHNRKLGMSMKVRAVGPDEVKDKLKALRDAKNPQAAVKEEKDELKKEKEEVEAKEEPEALQEEEEEADAEEDLEAMLKACGLPTSFGSKKQKR
jgi:hypothetical protein